MSSRPELHIAPCGYDAAKFAVEHWHYSGSMPVGKRVSFGVWEDDSFRGCILFARGATPNIGSPYGLEQAKICELVRVALRNHNWEVSRCLSIALSELSGHAKGLRLVVSYADPNQGHHGGIYQATNWIYAGRTDSARMFRINGDVVHPRTVGSAGGIQSIDWVRENMDPNAEEVTRPGKFRYLYPLDEDMRSKVEQLREPYPKPEDLPAPEA